LGTIRSLLSLAELRGRLCHGYLVAEEGVRWFGGLTALLCGVDAELRAGAIFFGLPYIEEVFVAGGGDIDFLLSGGAAEGGTDVFLAVGEFRDGDFQRCAGLQLTDVIEERGEDGFVLAIPALGDVRLTDGLEFHRIHRFSRGSGPNRALWFNVTVALM
jgi:hypothetical protein